MNPTTNTEIIQQWSAIPRAVVEAYGDGGDLARQRLLNPAIFALLGDVQGQRVLDAGCGTGYLARLLSRRGAQVLGLEPAAPLFEYAVEREREEPLGVEYVQANLSTWRDPERVFDVIVANMVLMDIPDYKAALDTCFTHLRPGGHLVLSLTHPCFEESDAEYQAKGYVAVREYFQEYRIEQQWGDRFHRPLGSYINALIQRGGVIRAIIEPKLDPEQARAEPEAARHLHVPGFIVIQVRKGRGEST